MNVSKVITGRHLKKSLLDCKISRFLKNWMFLHQKNIQFFLTTETYDIKLTNIKILDKNIVPSGWAQVAWNTDSAKTFQANFMIYGNKQGGNQISLGIWRFRGIGKNQNWVKTKCNPNTNGIQEALWVYWQDLGVKLLVGFQGEG